MIVWVAIPWEIIGIAGVLSFLGGWLLKPRPEKPHKRGVKIHRVWVNGKETDKRSVKKRLEDML